MEFEKRSIKNTELRAEGDNKPIIKGYAARFNSLSEDLGYFKEIIMPGAFRKTINDGADVRALFNHDPNFVIGRTKSGTLRIVEDDKGLFIEATPPETTWAKDLVTSIKRGDVDQMSFGFKTVKDNKRVDNGQNIRELLEVKLFDVSPVTYPAYPQTSVVARSLLINKGIEIDSIADILFRSEHGIQITKEDSEIINHSIEILRQFLAKSEPGNHSDGTKDNKSQVRNIANLSRRLEIAESESKLHKLYC